MVVQFMDLAEKVSVPYVLLDLCLMELESDHQLQVLLSFEVLRACTNLWSQGTAGKDCFQFNYISLGLFWKIKMNICFSKEGAASQDFNGKMI